MRIFGITVLTAFAALAAIAAPSQARDRNHDRIGDRWERSHHLSLHVNQARRDQDHDGLKNRGEFRAQTDPRDDDSDNDGVEDGDERAGTVESLEGDTLTITLFGGGTVTGKVTSATEIECDTGGDDDTGDDDHEGSKSSFRGDGEHGDDGGQSGDDQGDDEGDDESDNQSCPAGALKKDAIVQEAELKLDSGGAIFKKIELLG